MADIIGQHLEGDVKVTWLTDGERIGIKREQDVQALVDNVAAANANGIVTTDGMGRPVIEMPLVLAMDWCAKRGIPWEKFLYSNEYDAEWKRFAVEHSKLTYQVRARHMAVGK